MSFAIPQVMLHTILALRIGDNMVITTIEIIKTDLVMFAWLYVYDFCFCVLFCSMGCVYLYKIYANFEPLKSKKNTLNVTSE